MKKAEAIALLGGTATEAARAIGISSAAVSLWPDTLPARIADRVQAALYRRSQQSAIKTKRAPRIAGKPAEEQAEAAAPLADA